MTLLPYENLTIETKLEPKEAQRKLTDIVEPPGGWYWFWEVHKPFQGWVNECSFRLSRTSGRYMAVIKGNIRAKEDGSTISISIRPRTLAIVFMVMGSSLFGYIFFDRLATVVLPILGFGSVKQLAFQELVIPILMFVLWNAFYVAIFKFDSMRSIVLFRKLYEAVKTTNIKHFGMTTAQIRTAAILVLVDFLVLMTLAGIVRFTLSR
jgi:hypothetical protein